MDLNPISILASVSRNRMIMPFYHAINDRPPVHLKHLYHIFTEEQFEADLDFLLKHFQPISIGDLLAFVKNSRPLPKRCFLLPFDDGLREFGEVAFPILKKKGIPSALFVNPYFVDNKELFFRLKSSILIEAAQQNKIAWEHVNEVTGKRIDHFKEGINFLKSVSYPNRQVLDDLAPVFEVSFEEYRKNNRPYLTFDELRYLQQQGVFVGGHSLDHPLFNQLDVNGQLDQIRKSMTWIQENLLPAIPIFSFPFTDFGVTQELFQTISTDHPLNPALTFGCAGMKQERISTHWQRIPMEDKPRTAKQVIYQQYLYYLAKALLKKNTIKR